jgi:hypothetical protein
MQINPYFIRQNITLVATFLFIILFSVTYYMKPGFLFLADGSIRPFGVGYRNKTILPLWLYAIILGIFSYLGVLFLSS